MQISRNLIAWKCPSTNRRWLEIAIKGFSTKGTIYSSASLSLLWIICSRRPLACFCHIFRSYPLLILEVWKARTVAQKKYIIFQKSFFILHWNKARVFPNSSSGKARQKRKQKHREITHHDIVDKIFTRSIGDHVSIPTSNWLNAGTSLPHRVP